MQYTLPRCNHSRFFHVRSTFEKHTVCVHVYDLPESQGFETQVRRRPGGNTAGLELEDRQGRWQLYCGVLRGSVLAHVRNKSPDDLKKEKPLERIYSSLMGKEGKTSDYELELVVIFIRI